jgi:CRP-like cAMP-binding protein
MIALRAVALFAELGSRELADLAAVARWQTHAAGAAVDGVGDALHVVESGRLRVEPPGEELGPGGAFGELALFGEAPAARVTALDRSRTVVIARADFERLCDDSPRVALGVCRALARRTAR